MLASRHDTNTTRIGNLLDKHLRKASASDADSPAQNSHHFITFVDGFSYEDQDGASLEVRRLLLQHIGPEEGLYDCSQWARELKGAVIWVGPNSCFMVSPTGRTIDWSRSVSFGMCSVSAPLNI